jgi:hypothetical protein
MSGFALFNPVGSGLVPDFDLTLSAGLALAWPRWDRGRSALMAKMRRKTLIVCAPCHDWIHANPVAHAA